MKIKFISDLHCEWYNPNKIERILSLVIPPQPEDKETVICLQGDTGCLHKDWSFIQPLSILSKRFREVVVVLGNHEYYNNSYFDCLNEFRSKLSLPKNVTILENETKIIDDVAFIGATLWTDFNNSDFTAMKAAKQGMNDFQCIRQSPYSSSPYLNANVSNKLLPEDTVGKFEQSNDYIFPQIIMSKSAGYKTVVLTHHGISSITLDPRYVGDILNYAFYTELGNKIDILGPDIWAHGHQHNSFLGEIGNTKIVLNPYGYRDVGVNKNFNPNLVMEL